MEKKSAWKNRILKVLFCGLIMAAMLVCLSGCRDRITSRDDADKEVADETGTMATAYEERREELDLQEVAEPLMKNEKREEKDQNNKTEKSSQTDQNSKSGKNGKDVDGGKGNGAGKGTGKGNGGKGKGNNKKGKGDKKVKKVTVKFDANGGNCNPANDNSRKYTVGKAYGSLPGAKKNNCTFAGWFTKKTGGSGVNVSTVVPESDHTLYAHWTSGKAEVYTITFDPCEGRIKNREKTRTISPGSAYGSMPLPVKDGYDFLGWFTEAEGGTKITENSKFNNKSNQTLYAHWEYNPYKYWSTMRLRAYEGMYACQVVDCYIEFDDHKTVTESDLLSSVKIGNCARNRGSKTTVTDEWVEERNPTAIIKCKGNSSQAASIYSSVAERFPDRRIIVVPSAAVNGSKNEKLYYTLCLGAAIYPDWFGELDLPKAANELGVSGNIYEQ